VMLPVSFSPCCLFASNYPILLMHFTLVLLNTLYFLSMSDAFPLYLVEFTGRFAS